MTAPTTWPGLGFDPAPGDVAALDGLTGRLIAASRALVAARDTMESVRTAPGGWDGDAAQAFTSKVGELPVQLGAAHCTLDKVASELHRWQVGLEQLQARARDLEARAVTARRQVTDAAAAADAARSAPDLGLAGRHFDTDAELADAQTRLDTALAAVDDADRRLEDARGGLEQLISDGRRLLAEHAAGADTVATTVRGATEAFAPPEPGWLEETDEWVDDNPGTVGDVAGVVSAVAGTLALLPVLTPLMAPVALVSGAVALVAHAVDIGEQGSWSDPDFWATLAGDGLGMVPAVGALSKAADAGAAAARLSGGLLTSGGAVTELASAPISRGAEEFGRVFAAQALQPDATPVFEGLGREMASRWGGDAGLIGKVGQGLVNVGLQAPTVDALVHPSGEGESLKQPSGWVGVAANGVQLPPPAPGGRLADGLGRFARAAGR